MNYCSWVFWGPKKVIQEYLKDPVSLTKPKIRAKLAKPLQGSSERFDENRQRSDFLRHYQKGQLQFSYWGSHHYMVGTSMDKKKSCDLAWMALNHDSNSVLLLELIKPTGEYEDEKKAQELWDNFFQHAKILKDSLPWVGLGIQ